MLAEVLEALIAEARRTVRGRHDRWGWTRFSHSAGERARWLVVWL